jgi:hypothetical protein
MEADDDDRRAATASAPPPAAAATNDNQAAALPRPPPPRDWSPAKQTAPPLEQRPCASEASVHHRPPSAHQHQHWGSDADASATPTTSERMTSDGGASLTSAQARCPPMFWTTMMKLAESAARAALQQERNFTRARTRPNSAALGRVRVRVEDKYGQRDAVGAWYTGKMVAIVVVSEARAMGIFGIAWEEFEQICQKSARQRLLQETSSDDAS